MPLRQVINFNPLTKIMVWDVTETYDDLLGQVVLGEPAKLRIASMKSDQHRRGFLSVRMLLQKAGYSDLDLYYDEYGKPHLKDGKHISISHSHECAAVIIGDTLAGIDLELRRKKILVIADRFNDNSHLDQTDIKKFIREITVIWGVKESIFKIRNEAGISFLDHIIVAPFDLEAKSGTATLLFDNLNKEFIFHFEEPGDYTLVYAFEKNNDHRFAD